MGIKLGTFDSKNDFGMDFLGREIEFPTPKTKTVEVPMRDGVIDLTESLSGVVRYNNRKITLRFEIRDPRWEWADRISEIQTALHGKKIDLIFPDDPLYIWTGRCTIDSFKDNGPSGTLTISVDAGAFKHAITPREFGPYTVSGSSETVQLTADTDRSFFAFEVTGTVALTFDGETYNFASGRYADEAVALTVEEDGETYMLSVEIDGVTYAFASGALTVPGLFIAKGNHEIVFSGTGTVTMYIYEGVL